MPRQLVAVILALMLAMSAMVAQAETATEITFEPPEYTTGTIHDQHGWVSRGNAQVQPHCFVTLDHEVDEQSLYPSFGVQSLRISNGVTSSCLNDQTFSQPLLNEAGETSAENGGESGGARQTRFEAQWDFASTVPAGEQVGLSVVASPDRGDGKRMSWIQMADTADGLMVGFYDYQTSVADFVFTEIAAGLDRSIPHTVKIRMDFVDGPSNDVVTVWVDGIEVHVGTSWEDYYTTVEMVPTRTVDSILFRTAGTAAPATTGNGFYIDNFTIASGLEGIPSEPTTSIEACLYAGSLSQVTVVEVGEESTLSCGRGEQVTLQAGVDYYACLYAGSLSQFGTTEPVNCGRGEVISFAAGYDLHGCMYAGRLSQVSANVPANCGRGTQVDLAMGEVIVVPT